MIKTCIEFFYCKKRVLGANHEVKYQSCLRCNWKLFLKNACQDGLDADNYLKYAIE